MILFVFGFAVLASCNKNEEDDDDNDDNTQDTVETEYNKQEAVDATLATNVYGEVIGYVAKFSDNEDSKGVKTDCPTASLEPLVGYPKTLVLDFGTEGCDANGHTVKGSITAELSGRIRKEGTTISISFNNFSIDTLTVDGAISLTIDEVDVITEKIIKLTAEVSDATITMPSGIISANGNLSVTWEMNELLNYEDDILKTTALSLTGTNRTGKSLTASLVETLTYNISCMETTDGKIEVSSPDNEFPATIDFGNGTCDGVADITTTISVTIGNQTFEKTVTEEITLP